ncbi:hypothetical protein H0H81_000160, partial [Sphagnurus paluster]
MAPHTVAAPAPAPDLVDLVEVDLVAKIDEGKKALARYKRAAKGTRKKWGGDKFKTTWEEFLKQAELFLPTPSP